MQEAEKVLLPPLNINISQLVAKSRLAAQTVLFHERFVLFSRKDLQNELSVHACVYSVFLCAFVCVEKWIMCSPRDLRFVVSNSAEVADYFVT